MAALLPASAPLNPEEIGAGADTRMAWKTQVEPLCSQTVRRFLPFARLLFRIRRPDRVRIRNLNPCVLFRLMLLG